MIIEMEKEYITEHNSITTALNDALDYCYQLHHDGQTILAVNIDIASGKINIIIQDADSEDT